MYRSNANKQQNNTEHGGIISFKEGIEEDRIRRRKEKEKKKQLEID